MNRKFEKRLAYLGALWQVASGLYTMFIYSIKVRGLEESLALSSYKVETSAKVMSDNLYMFSVTFGMLFIIIGAVNIYLIRKLSDKRPETKIPVWFFVCGILSYLVTDFISAAAFIVSGVITLARNKAIIVYYKT
ncbi:hypothetical protein M2651_01465 [Clostridium sp. SYSU_GA19001]|uniref:hypothetical protein n=1 Tax=Clostridium caldaquaticum TaxID=2940653 RepID=UPI0020771EB9|nr:hypothetical protein [Clostridium caldaquaticum]MCM8709688.1 hypothetical protein [Clostridium caldaquaticum]